MNIHFKEATMKFLQKILMEIYFLSQRRNLNARTARVYLIHVGGCIGFFSTAIKHKRRGNDGLAEKYLFKHIPEQFFYAIREFFFRPTEKQMLLIARRKP
jgi:hypothetical protein